MRRRCNVVYVGKRISRSAVSFVSRFSVRCTDEFAREIVREMILFSRLRGNMENDLFRREVYYGPFKLNENPCEVGELFECLSECSARIFPRSLLNRRSVVAHTDRRRIYWSAEKSTAIPV